MLDNIINLFRAIVALPELAYDAYRACVRLDGYWDNYKSKSEKLAATYFYTERERRHAQAGVDAIFGVSQIVHDEVARSFNAFIIGAKNEGMAFVSPIRCERRHYSITEVIALEHELKLVFDELSTCSPEAVKESAQSLLL